VEEAVLAALRPVNCLRISFYDVGEGAVSFEGDGDCTGSGSSFLWAGQEVRNATAIKAVIKDKRNVFIGCV
jgi:hypothetical protein